MSLQVSHFRRGGGRRRRLLTEEPAEVAGETGVPVSPILRVASPSPHKSEYYGDADFLDHQLRLIDVAPRRPVALVLLLLAGLTGIVGLECTYAWLPELAAQTGGRLTALDLGAAGSLGNWFSSLLLLAAAGGAALIYSVRRHKTDDYRGRYRIWLWAAGCWFLMATDSAASLHQGFQEVMTALAGTRLMGDGSIWWVSAWLLLLTVLGARLIMDMWSCRLSSAALILGWIGYMTSFAAHLGWLLPEGVAAHVLVRQGVKLAGDLLVLLAMGLHVRYVLMDAQGMLPRSEQKSKPARESKRAKKGSRAAAENTSAFEDDSEGPQQAKQERVATVASQSNSQPALARASPTPASTLPAPVTTTATPVAARPAAAPTRPAAAPAPASAKLASPPAPVATPDDDEVSDGNQKLSKADRKALKKRLLEERLKREQRTATKW